MIYRTDIIKDHTYRLFISITMSFRYRFQEMTYKLISKSGQEENSIHQ
jgi:hypothetical protein